MINMITLNKNCTCVWVEDDCYQVCELFENEYYMYYMTRDEIKTEFNIDPESK